MGAWIFHVIFKYAHNISHEYYPVKPRNEKFYVRGEIFVDGKVFAKLIESALAEKGIKKGDFYDAVGISATAMYGWKNGAVPKKETVEAVEKYLDLELFPYEKSDPREELREDHKMLLKSVDGLPQSSVYEIIAEIHKRREAGWGDPTY